jgi:uncharacterized lipoprotein YbaY
MTYTGHVQNGMIVFPTPVPLPEGAEVTVALSTAVKPRPLREILKKYLRHQGQVELPPDAASNVDRYVNQAVNPS